MISFATVLSSSLAIAAPPDFCKTPDGILDISRYNSCQESIGLAACGALGTVVAGRTAALALRKFEEKFSLDINKKNREQVAQVAFENFKKSRRVSVANEMSELGKDLIRFPSQHRLPTINLIKDNKVSLFEA